MHLEELQRLLAGGEDSQHQFKREISAQFQRSFAFIKRNLHHVQNGRGFNTLGELEVPPIALEELLPYRGLGSGIHRARQAWPQIELQDHRSGNEFRAVVARPQVGTQSIDPVTPPVTPPVMALLALLADKGPLGNAEIREYMQLKDRTHVRQHYIEPALAQALIEYTLPDKPTSRLQRYRLTEAGQALVQQERP